MGSCIQKPRILCVNPWIHDFAAYDVWATPVGLLVLASLLKEKGFSTGFIDCLSRFHPKSAQKTYESKQGRGPYIKTRIPQPEGLENIKRRYSRYGILPEWLREDLLKEQKPDLVFVTSMMTYWAGGVKETIAHVKDVWPDVPVVLGGIYATLCAEHARTYSGADLVVEGPAESLIFDIVEKYTGVSTEIDRELSVLDNLPYPALDLQHKISHVPLLTGRGCPNRCAYCASGYLSPVFSRRSPANVVEEIIFWRSKYGVVDFAFYDDALLFSPETHIKLILKGLVDRKADVRLHTPNALHVRYMDDDMAFLMKRAGFYTIRLGVETTDFSERRGLDRKISENDFFKAAASLKKAGFERQQIGAYLLVGLPGQTFEEVEHSIREVLSAGLTPVLTYYTPIPHTALWEQAVQYSPWPVEKDPVFTNNSIWPCRWEGFSWNDLTRLKNLVRSV